MTHKNLSDEEIKKSFPENSLRTMKKRYLIERDDGNKESPADMFRRVAKSLAKAEKDYGHNESFVKEKEDEFFEIMSSQEFTPAGRTLRNAGAETDLVANCIVLPLEDSMDGIFQTLKEAALLQQSGSGLGFAFDNLRPAMAPTIRTQGKASGPVSFLNVYNEAFGTIKQQQRTGANMAMMSVEHPDILDFIRAKAKEGAIANFNISVKVTDRFMEQLENDPDTQWYCEWDGERMKPRDVKRHPNGAVYETEPVDITVGELFDEISKYAWVNGEPGIVFIDTVNDDNPLPELGRIKTSNPCGEQFLHGYDNCNLGSINLSQFVTEEGKIDYKRLRYVTKVATRMLDNVIDQFDFPVEEVTEFAKKNRRIGLGIMGFGDMLYQLGIGYDTEEGRKTAEKVMGTINDVAHETSKKLALEKGPFPNYKKSIYDDGSMRNAALTTVAPTGSISMVFDTSGGVEPNFALSFVKQDKDGEQYHYLNKYFVQALEERGFSDEKIEKIKEEVVEKGTIQHMDNIPEDIKETFVTSMDISGDDHIKMQASFQKHVDNSISKTINLPNEATQDDIRNSFVLAWKEGCKSCTVYREGSRNIQILNIGDGEDVIAPNQASSDGEIDVEALKEKSEMDVKVDDSKEEKESSSEETKTDKFPAAAGKMNGKLKPRERPEQLTGETYKIKTGYGNLYITVNDDSNGQPFEVFATIGKTGGFFQEQSEAICRLISLSLRTGVGVENIIDQLKGIRGPMPVLTSKGTVLSLPDAIAMVLEDHTGKEGEDKLEDADIIDKVEGEMDSDVDSEVDKEPSTVGAMQFNEAETEDANMELADYGSMPGCPECGSALQISEGCMSCRSCGFSRCG